ncbi:MAG: M14 family metallopeptidase [Pirellulaceae bacterium]
MTDIDQMFSPNYFTARRRFVEAARFRQWQLDRIDVTCERTLDLPAQESPLSIDVATSTGDRSLPTLLLTSGLHGVEGFLGSAVQLNVLRDWQPTRPMRVVLVHALNPFGYVFLRRADEQNRDLNRNFLLDDEHYEGSSTLYGTLNGLLNPEHTPRRFDLFIPQLAWCVLRHGMGKLQAAIASGQYEYPRGLFYGGSSLNPIAEELSLGLQRWLAGTSHVVHLDFHTGLGKYAMQVIARHAVDCPTSS